MRLFQTKYKNLTEIHKDSFKLEADIQSLVESNMETIFGLEFVCSEFRVGGFRVDSLAYDKQNNAFVIVEYKKGHSYSVVDQGYSYLSVMVNNKAEFILEYNEKTRKTIKRDDVDWTSSRVIFVSPSFNSYQKNSVNFRDVPFELWEIRKFEGGLVVIEQCESTSEESIEKITKSNSTSVISKVSAEVKVPSENDYVNVLEDSVKQVWFSLRERLEKYTDTTFGITQSYVSWKRDSITVCFIRFTKKEIRIELFRGNKKVSGNPSKGFFNIDDPKKLTTERTWTWKSGITGHSYHFSLSKQEDLDYVMFLIEQKYNSLE